MKNRLKSTAYISLFTFLGITIILGALQPFDIDKLELNEKIAYLLSLGTIGAIICAAVYLPMADWMESSERKHGYLARSVYAMIIIPLNAMAIATINYEAFGWQNFSWSDQFFHLIWDVAAVEIILFVIDYLIYRSISLKAEITELKNINDYLTANTKKETPEGTESTCAAITLSGTTTDSVTVAPDNILFAEADANYINIHYLKDGKEIVGQIRKPIKHVEADLADYVYLKRCHRAYIVNVNHICHVEGNNKGYRLQIHKSNTEVPVSRTFVSSLFPQMQ